MNTGRQSALIVFWPAGVVHLDDVIYLFPQHRLIGSSELTAQDQHMVDTMTAIWTNFARKGYVTVSGRFGA